MGGFINNFACDSFYRFYHGKNLKSNSKRKGGFDESLPYTRGIKSQQNKQGGLDESSLYNIKGPTAITQVLQV